MRKVFFHGGRFHALKDAAQFYVERDTNSGEWYPHDISGKGDRFDDLPMVMRWKADTKNGATDPKTGESPVWTSAEIDDVVAFLKTRNDVDMVSVAVGK